MTVVDVVTGCTNNNERLETIRKPMYEMYVALSMSLV